MMPFLSILLSFSSNTHFNFTQTPLFIWYVIRDNYAVGYLITYSLLLLKLRSVFYHHWTRVCILVKGKKSLRYPETSFFNFS